MCNPRETAPKGIEWKDLVPVTRRQIVNELLLPLPWLLLSLGLYASPIWPLGFLASFMFFLCALRLNHEAIHGNLSLPRRADIALLHGLSAIMVGCNTSVAWSHMQHHRHAMGSTDIEGHCGHMSAWQVLAYGPVFPLHLIRSAWTRGGAKWRRRMAVDGLCVGASVSVMIAIGGPLMLHLVAMGIAQCLTAFFAVWITHQGTHHSGLAARSQRGLAAKAAYLMFYHREHHLFPQVPVARLPDLAARLDRDAPGYAAAHTPVIPWLELSSGKLRKPG